MLFPKSLIQWLVFVHQRLILVVLMGSEKPKKTWGVKDLWLREERLEILRTFQ